MTKLISVVGLCCCILLVVGLGAKARNNANSAPVTIENLAADRANLDNVQITPVAATVYMGAMIAKDVESFKAGDVVLYAGNDQIVRQIDRAKGQVMFCRDGDIIQVKLPHEVKLVTKLVGWVEQARVHSALQSDDRIVAIDGKQFINGEEAFMLARSAHAVTFVRNGKEVTEGLEQYNLPIGAINPMRGGGQGACVEPFVEWAYCVNPDQREGSYCDGTQIPKKCGTVYGTCNPVCTCCTKWMF